MQIADYGDLGPGLYELQNCEILGRVRGSEHWFVFGDCDSARIEISTTKIQRKARNKRVRNVVQEDVTDVVSTLAIRAMQYSDEVRSIALLGEPVAHTQDATAWTLDIKAVHLGGIYYAKDVLDIGLALTAKESVYDAEDDTFTAGDAILGIQYVVVDQSAGGFRITGGVAEGDTIQIAGTKTAISAADKRTRIDFATVTAKDLELKIRGVSDIGAKFIFELNKWLGTPSGIDLIGGDDYSGQDLTGTLSAINGKIGTWQRLAA